MQKSYRRWFRKLNNIPLYEKNMNQLVLRVGGEAGRGLATTADIIAKVFVKLGYHVFSSKEYASQIKGGHNYHTLRLSEEEVQSDQDEISVLIAFDPETLKQHQKYLTSPGYIFTDENFEFTSSLGIKKITLPLNKLELELKEKKISNSLLMGAFFRSVGIDFKLVEQTFKEFFKEKPQHVERNLIAVRKGYDNFTKREINFIDIEKNNFKTVLHFLSGNEALALGALTAGLKFHAQYPMTPVSGILHYLAQESLKNKQLIVVQPEDEIAGINFALGASYAGARSMVATSGGGFSLMVEGLGLSAMAEIPLVIVEGQRPGPSTGLPTKTGQGDLKFALSAGVDDFPRVVIAPGNIPECYTETKRAFYLAEKYQIPVIILIDKQLAESFQTFDLKEEEKKLPLDFSQSFNIVNEVYEDDLSGGMFKRYSGEDKYRRTLPGTVRGMYTCAGDEHDEVGEITEDTSIRVKMVHRRMKKMSFILRELPVPEIYGVYPSSLTVISWGSNLGAIKEAVDLLIKEGEKINFLPLKYMSPFPSDNVRSLLSSTQKMVLIENNYSAQLASLLMEKTGIEIKDKILRYDGKAFSIKELYLELKKRC